jgi:hypothetical protein
MFLWFWKVYHFQDDYEGDFSTRRALIYTLRFTAKTYLFGPVAESTDGLIRKVQVDMYTVDWQLLQQNVKWDTPLSPDPIDADPDDNFGFNENWEFLDDSKEL